MDGLLAYMYTMIRECAAQGIRLDRDYLVRSGEAIELFPGVREWFARITAYGADLGVDVEHYVISSGLREIIEGNRQHPQQLGDEVEHETPEQRRNFSQRMQSAKHQEYHHPHRYDDIRKVDG